MAVSDDLFRLVKSLTKSERRHFTLSCNLYDKEKLYMKLFSLIDEQKEYDEQSIRLNFPTNQFSVAKTRLFQLITESLTNFQSEGNVDRNIRLLLEQAEVLQHRNFDEAANKLFEKARNKAIKTGRYELALEAIRLHRREILSKSQVDELYRIKSDLIQKINRLSTLKLLCIQIEQLFQEKGFVKSSIDLESYQVFIQNENITQEDLGVDPEYDYYFNLLHAWYYFIVGEPEKVHDHLLSILFFINSQNRIETDQLWIQRNVDILLFYYRVCIYCKRDIELEFVREQFSGIVLTNSQRVLYYAIQTEDILFNTQNLSESVVEEFEKNLHLVLQSDQGGFPVLSLLYSLVNYYFIHKNFRKALKHCNAFLNHKNAQNCFLFHKITQLYLLSHYELKNHEIVLIELKSYLRKPTNKNESSIEQKQFISLIKKLSSGAQKEKVIDEVYDLCKQESKKNNVFDVFENSYNSWLQN